MCKLQRSLSLLGFTTNHNVRNILIRVLATQNACGFQPIKAFHRLTHPSLCLSVQACDPSKPFHAFCYCKILSHMLDSGGEWKEAYVSILQIQYTCTSSTPGENSSQLKRRPGRPRMTWSAERERAKGDVTAVIGDCNSLCRCERPEWVESISEWPGCPAGNDEE